ncbi:MAG: chemotaxis protein CheB [Halanaerobiaceae bacterium]
MEPVNDKNEENNNKIKKKTKNLNKEYSKDPGEKMSEEESENFPIIGIGASAGGLEAFKQFFSKIPEDRSIDMALVLVQHLSPDHESSLTEIIQNFTGMEVLEVKDGMKVQRDCVYIIPHDSVMTFEEGTLKLKEFSASRGQRMPIDVFFRSLAEDLGERAICVILSGTGSDGTLGLRSIKGNGGMAMVQKPESAKFDGMPRSAIKTGLVDYELPPEEMYTQLEAYVSHAFNKKSIMVSEKPKRSKILKEIIIQLRNHTGHDFSQYRNSTIIRRIEHRMSVQQIKSIGKYVEYLKQTPEEVENLFRDLLIGVTSFFRNPKAFEVLKKEVIPDLFSQNRESGLLRIWIPGCSTGEEAYSIAILIAECEQELNQSFKIQIFATDIDDSAIEQARRGRFPASIATDISPERLSQFFELEEQGNNYQIDKRIREMLVFSEHNIIEDPPFSRLDLISCRNLLIYMKRNLQEKIISLFRYSLNRKGYLFLGTSETLGESSSYFNTVDNKWKVYQLEEKTQNSVKAIKSDFSPQEVSNDNHYSAVAATLEKNGDLSLRELTEEKLLSEFTPPAVLVNSNGKVLFIHGHTGLYLEPSPGQAGFENIIKMARKGLKSSLVSALHESTAEQKKVFYPNLQVESNGGQIATNLTICPVQNKSNSKYSKVLYLIVLEQISSSNEDLIEEVTEVTVNGLEDVSEIENPEKIINKLKQKLRSKEQSLQNTVEELQTTNEELRSSNEELQSVNEELQSTNEELETSKEELQSLNEELKTVNSELEEKVEALEQTNTDMNNLLSGTGIGTVFLDLDLRILRFTPSAKEFINLIDSDTGRPVNHIASNLRNYDELAKDTQEVLDTLVPKEIEVQNQKGDWYMLRIQPYRTENNVIKGAVITFIDISEKKQIENTLCAAMYLIAQKFPD